MKHIWKMLLAMAVTMMMIACPDPNNKDNNGGGDGVYSSSTTGIYSYSGTVGSISNAWGGSPASPSFSILLLKDSHVDSFPDWTDDEFVKNASLEEPAYQLNAWKNMTFPTVKDGTFVVSGSEGDYTGVAAIVSGSMANYKIVVDMSKVVKADLKMLAVQAETVIEESANVDLTGYKPYVIAIAAKTTAEDGTETNPTGYTGYGWNGAVVAMTEEASFPASFDEKPENVTGTVVFAFNDETVFTLTDVTGLKGFGTGYNFYGASANGSGTFTLNSEGDTVNVEMDGTPVHAGALWQLEQLPNTLIGVTATADNYGSGTVFPIKFKIGADEGWTLVTVGDACEFSWTQRK